jgi:hypothetical protein
LAPEGRKPNVTDINLNLRGGLIIKRALMTLTTKATSLTLNMAKLAKKTTKREEAENKDLMEKYNAIIGEYSKIQQDNIEF